MSVITARITVAPDGTLSGRVSADVPAGEHEASIFVEDAPPREPDLPLDWNDWPSHDFGPWPEGMTLRREDMYGDDGR